MTTKSVYEVLKSATTTTSSDIFPLRSRQSTLQAKIAGSGAVSATIDWYGSNTTTKSDAIKIATSTLSGTSSDKTGAVITAEWPYIYAEITAISGTNATINAWIAN